MSKGDESKFHKLTVDGRIAVVEDITGITLDREALNRGGITTENANSMIENVIGKISLPLAVVPSMKIN
jgi:hydroxymethylglutaryl-CoA reductase